MTRFHFQQLTTPTGDPAAYSTAPEGPEGGNPLVVFLHGARRSSELLFVGSHLLSDVAETMIIDLHGHGRSAGGAASIPGMAEAVHATLSVTCSKRQVLLAGGSLGGSAAALAVAGLPVLSPVSAVFAAEARLSSASPVRRSA